MRKTELFALITETVVNVTEISKEQIFSKYKYAEIVDARYLIANYCYQIGLYISEIARMMGLSRRAVEKMVSQFEDRKKYGGPIFNMQCEQIANSLRSRMERVD